MPKHYAMKAHGGVSIKATHFTFHDLMDLSEQLRTRTTATPRKLPSTNCTGGWMNLSENKDSSPNPVHSASSQSPFCIISILRCNVPSTDVRVVGYAKFHSLKGSVFKNQPHCVTLTNQLYC